MSKIGKLSGSTDGKLIQVTATGTPGTVIHTAVTGTTQLDEPIIYAVNNHTAAVALEIEFGDATATTNVVVTIPADSGQFQICKNLVLQNAQIIRCFAGTAGVIAIGGKVLRSDASETI